MVSAWRDTCRIRLRRISAVAGRAGRVAEVLLRVNLTGPFPAATLSMAGRPTQFGIDEPSCPRRSRAPEHSPTCSWSDSTLHSLSNNLCADAHLDLLDLYRRKVTASSSSPARW